MNLHRRVDIVWMSTSHIQHLTLVRRAKSTFVRYIYERLTTQRYLTGGVTDGLKVTKCWCGVEMNFLPQDTPYQQLATTEILPILSKLSIYFVAQCSYVTQFLCFFGPLANQPPNDHTIPTVAHTVAPCADTTSLWAVGFSLSFWVEKRVGCDFSGRIDTEFVGRKRNFARGDWQWQAPTRMKWEHRHAIDHWNHL